MPKNFIWIVLGLIFLFLIIYMIWAAAKTAEAQTVIIKQKQAEAAKPGVGAQVAGITSDVKDIVSGLFGQFGKKDEEEEPVVPQGQMGPPTEEQLFPG
ncbi:hypothetical protein JYU20_00565 [Bacteroidales bacterium AH-315-I05]|nr:hypothetical protein [Bacteroidales bacterium AH-315-I05]